MPKLANPLSPTTFLRRNAGKTIPLVAVIMLAVMLIQCIIALINSIPLSIRTIYRYTDAFLGVSPRLDPTIMPSLVKDLTTKPPVEIERVILCRGSNAQVKSIVGNWPFAVMALEPKDADYYFERQGVTEIEGRRPKVGEAEMVVSEPVARNLKLKIGSIALKPEDSDNFAREEVKVVGIAKTERWLMVADKEFMARTQPIRIEFALIFAKDKAKQRQYDEWAVKKMKGKFTQLFAYHEIEEEAQKMFAVLYKIIDVVIGILVVVICLLMGMLMNIYQSQRMVEYGLLQAIGFTKRQLVIRSLLEAVLVIIGGWILGVTVSRGLLLIVKSILMDPQAFALEISDPMAMGYTIPVPFAILAITLGTVWLRFRRFDPVAIVERRIA